MKMLVYVVCTAGVFVWNERSLVQLPAPYIMLYDFSSINAILQMLHVNKVLKLLISIRPGRVNLYDIGPQKKIVDNLSHKFCHSTQAPLYDILEFWGGTRPLFYSLGSWPSVDYLVSFFCDDGKVLGGNWGRE